jgi:hypothetical protein
MLYCLDSATKFLPLCLISLAMMMEVVSTFETSVSFYNIIRRNVLEDSHLLLFYF